MDTEVQMLNTRIEYRVINVQIVRVRRVAIDKAGPVALRSLSEQYVKYLFEFILRNFAIEVPSATYSGNRRSFAMVPVIASIRPCALFSLFSISPSSARNRCSPP